MSPAISNLKSPVGPAAPSVADLHKLGRSVGFPASELHEILHDMAVTGYNVGSLTELSPAQRRRLADDIRAHRAASPPPDRRPSAGRRPSSRPRRGAPRRDGVVRMATERQRDLIAKLTGELGWTTSMLDRCCQFEVGLADGLAGVRTTVDAMHLIKVLIAHKWRRDRVDHTGSRRGAGPRSRG